jgi:hypothetical protein
VKRALRATTPAEAEKMRRSGFRNSSLASAASGSPKPVVEGLGITVDGRTLLVAAPPGKPFSVSFVD